MGGEGSTMAMISSLKNNRNLIQKISPLERRSKYLKKLKTNNQVKKTASTRLLKNIREQAQAEQRRYKNTLIVVFSFLIVLLVVFLIIWI
jgi:predicted nucleic acid-binding Zn ribbon protein